MIRVLYALKSPLGYLYELEDYTDDPEKAITFADFDAAVERLTAVKDKLKHNCRVVAVGVSFPRNTPIQIETY